MATISIMLSSMVIFLLTASCIQADDGDCSLEKTEVHSVSLYFYGHPNRTFSADDEIYMRRCNEQLDSTDYLLCYAKQCLTGKGLEFIRRLIRAVQYQVLHVCHPHANPAQQKAFKRLTDCKNTNYPKLYKCDRELCWKTAAAVTDSGVDIARYCCTMHELKECFVAATAECSAEDRAAIEEIGQLYLGEGMKMLCTGTPYLADATNCGSLPLVDTSGNTPPPLFASFANIAKAL